MVNCPTGPDKYWNFHFILQCWYFYFSAGRNLVQEIGCTDMVTYSGHGQNNVGNGELANMLRDLYTTLAKSCQFHEPIFDKGWHHMGA